MVGVRRQNQKKDALKFANPGATSTTPNTFAWRHIRRVNICDEVASLVREKRVRSVEHLTIHDS